MKLKLSNNKEVYVPTKWGIQRLIFDIVKDALADDTDDFIQIARTARRAGVSVYVTASPETLFGADVVAAYYDSGREYDEELDFSLFVGGMDKSWDKRNNPFWDRTDWDYDLDAAPRIPDDYVKRLAKAGLIVVIE